MAKYKYFNNNQMEFLVVNFKEQLVPDTFVYAILDDVLLDALFTLFA